MGRRQLVLDVLDGKETDSVPVGFWFHFLQGEDLVKGLSDPTAVERNIERHFHRLFEEFYCFYGYQFSYIATESIEEIHTTLRPNTKPRFIETLAVRIDRQSENARMIAQYLRNQPKIDRVFYVVFPDHSQYGLSCQQSRGFGSRISFNLKNAADIPKVPKSLKLMMYAESPEGVETLMTYPIEQTHKAIPQEVLKRSGVQENLLRLSVGIENVQDLLQDLEQAFR